MTGAPAPSEEVVYERIYACNFGMLMRREHPLAALPAVAHRELAGVHLAIDGSRVNKETFCAAENSKFGLTPIIDYDVRHLDPSPLVSPTTVSPLSPPSSTRSSLFRANTPTWCSGSMPTARPPPTGSNANISAVP